MVDKFCRHLYYEYMPKLLDADSELTETVQVRVSKKALGVIREKADGDGASSISSYLRRVVYRAVGLIKDKEK